MPVTDFLGRTKSDSDEVSLTQCRRMAALLNLDPASIKTGDPMPFPWAVMLFAEVARQDEIGEDGHPRRGDFLPPVALPRRRFAGRSITFHAPMRVGDKVERRSTIAEITEKHGRSGKLIFVTILHEIAGPSGLAITERQKVVYLDIPRREAPVAVPTPESAPTLPDWQSLATPDPVMLFRYSALTFNGHRIHYDCAYAHDVEGYPGLVVNGGLTTLLLLEGARANLDKPISGYDMRAIKPLFAGRSVSLNGVRTDSGALLWAVCEGETAMRIDVRC